jgi:hypothetical protein
MMTGSELPVNVNCKGGVPEFLWTEYFHVNAVATAAMGRALSP